MTTYLVHYRDKVIEVHAGSGPKAQAKAATHLGVQPWALDYELYTVNGKLVGNVSITAQETII